LALSYVIFGDRTAVNRPLTVWRLTTHIWVAPHR